ncbi:MAG TPA: FAD-linked oxidase C-terminal domain-containing protein [Jatrophihabitantaceae bacterium]|nr:FAD-linked oxidase C-terminal domain-containing protein [Jatrophihabitantaceae bacterium]
MTELVAALRRAGVAEVDDSARRRAEYSSDASNYRVVPVAVAFPRDADEVAAALDVCRSLGMPLTMRGAGTSIVGNAVGTGLVLDTSVHLTEIRELDPEAATAVVEPGVVLDRLQAAAAPYGLRFGPDPSSHSRATLGGMIGNNACGSRALAYGRTSDNVLALTALAGTGRIASAVAAELEPVVRANLEVLRTEFGRFGRQVSGYALEHLLPERGADVTKMLVGTEGTLGVVTEATVRLVRTPAVTALVVLGYPDMATAADAAPALLPHRPVAVEGLDARLVDVVRRRAGRVPDLPAGAGWLLVEVAGETSAEAVAAGKRLAADGATSATAIVTGAAAATVWRIREDGAGLAGRLPDGTPCWPGWEDAAVPPERLGTYLREFFALLAEHRLDTLAYGHFGDGCVHARIDFPLGTEPARLRAFTEAAADLVAEHGGSISGEHGDGRARGELLRRMYSTRALAAMAAVKDVFDPNNLLNPGVIVDPRPLDADLRLPVAPPRRRGLALAYPHDDGDFSAAVHRCVGVGKCRADTTATGGVMCPSYLATRDEKDSTRGRARVLQEMVNGSVVDGWRSDAVRDALDLCLSCKGCSFDCPAGVDMATYKAEALYQRYRRRPRPRSHYSLGWLPRWARLSPRLANLALRAPGGRAVAGVDRRRGLPRFARQTFRQWFADRPVASGKPVLLWVDTFTDHFAPQVGQAAVRVLEDAGYAVQIPRGHVCCGLTWISTGQLDGARRQLRRSLAALEGALADATAIVGLEPSCTAVFRSDAAELLPEDPRAVQASTSVRTLAELLQGDGDWSAPDLSNVRAVAQPHCHHHAVLGWSTDAELLRRAGAQVTAVGGCCGLAGNFGAERGHYDVSVAVAETALLPAVRAAPDAVVLADGFSCRTQLAELAGRDGIHLAQLLDAHRKDQS